MVRKPKDKIVTTDQMDEKTNEMTTNITQRQSGKENKLKQCQAAIQKVWTFLEQYVPFCNTHGAEFLSHDHWEKYLPPEAQKELLCMSDEDLVKLPLCFNETETATDSQWLYSYIKQAYMCHLENLNVLSTLSEAVSENSGFEKSRTEAMSIKKGHEVSIMSQAVSAVFNSTAADMVVDVGSGKGYLGAELSRTFNIPVLGLDSQETNTHGAKRRELILNKRFKKKKQQIETNNTKTEVSVASKQSCLDTCITDQNLEQRLQSVNNLDDVPVKYVPMTVFVQPDMGLRNIIQHIGPQLCSTCDNIDRLHFVLTGLHTCGSLAVTLMNLFLQDPGAVALVSVGCCYQQMEEAHYTDGDPTDSKHFPLSILGKKMKMYLGRNARNLASQSLHRIQASKQLQGKDFYWRALLDVIIRNLGLSVPEKIKGIRGLNKKSPTFKDYAMRALSILGISPELVPDDNLHLTETLHQDNEKKLAALFQVKLVLAPVIETLILLDRLMFLLEQDTVESTHLVRLFDPLTSPRCYCLLSVKTSGT
ncbi:probable methyltransferase-like protein 25 isoform X1 [Biomphalaria glabrata]|uniref:Probable methyltransferase-like protein 25 isoform X1 n=2 Tax=Biomphalaria glabrata TaxID=6526 RepID=A0A9W3ARA8_BIOGL|nr:probable methyltransferase-like protein 25 isoform X1 [Biomphalaria glabrata]